MIYGMEVKTFNVFYDFQIQNDSLHRVHLRTPKYCSTLYSYIEHTTFRYLGKYLHMLVGKGNVTLEYIWRLHVVVMLPSIALLVIYMIIPIATILDTHTHPCTSWMIL